MKPRLIQICSMGLLALITTLAGAGTAESILEGLQKAEAREARQRNMHLIMDGKVEQAYRCRLGDLQREISVIAPPADSGYLCVVRYESEKGDKMPWQARTDPDYCRARASELVDRLHRLGWVCSSADFASRADP